MSGARAWCCVFFFQAEDGIRDLTVTGVQTCALPICDSGDLPPTLVAERHRVRRERDDRLRVHHEAELARGAVGERISVLRRLLPGHEWAIRQLDPPDPLDVGVSLPAR